MLRSEQIRKLFVALNAELAKIDVLGEVGLCGGAVMCLVFNARPSTKDVDAIFQPTAEIRKAAVRVARDLAVEPDWLNDAAKGFFLSHPPRQSVMEMSHLRVWAPSPEYMLGMKCVSARFDGHDKDDVMFLIRYLRLQTPQEVFSIIEKYYPQHLIPPKTRFLVEEVLDRK